jgi:3',5'-cyclic AMP phosphodiesterase CpdA
LAKLLVLTDLHSVEEGADIIGLDPFARAKEVLDHALANHSDADHLIITGDLTHHGRIAQYERLKELLAAVQMPMTLLLGNHDRRDEFNEVFGEDGFAQNAVDVSGTKLICLDTLDGPPYPTGHHAGLLCDERLQWLDVQLSGVDRAIVFMHHPPFNVGFDGMDEIKLANSDAFFEIIKRHGNVDQLICGHVHRTISGNVRGVPFTIFKSPCHQMPMVLGDGDSSLSVDEPGAYGIILIEHDSIIAHSEDVFPTSRLITVDGHSA